MTVGNSEITHEVRNLTNKEALELLKLNTRNRKVSEAKIREYVSAMKKNNWQLNGQAITFSKLGELLDGQHRLLAISKLEDGIAVPVTIGRGFESNSFDTIDIGKKRSPSDLLSIYGIDSKNTGTLSAAAKLLHDYYESHKKVEENATTKKKVVVEKDTFQNKDFYDFINRDEHKNLFMEGVKKVLANKSNLMLSPGESLFMYVLVVGLNKDKGEEFCNQIFTNTGIVEGSSVHILSSRLKSGASKTAHVDKHTRIAFTLVTWNHFVSDKNMNPNLLSKSKIKDQLHKVKAKAI